MEAPVTLDPPTQAQIAAANHDMVDDILDTLDAIDAALAADS